MRTIALLSSFLAVCHACTVASAQEPKTKEMPAPAKTEPPARPKDAAALFAAMAAIPGLEAKFEEEKHLSLLAVPLTSKGRICFQRAADGKGGYLTRVVESPEASTVRITPRELRLENRDGVEVVDLQRSDKVRTFVTALVQVFTGDQQALDKSFTIAFAPDPATATGWTLTLAPRGAPLDKMMKSLQLVGDGKAVVRIEMIDPNGDRTVTRIVGADPARKFDADEQKRLFGIEPR